MPQRAQDDTAVHPAAWVLLSRARTIPGKQWRHTAPFPSCLGQSLASPDPQPAPGYSSPFQVPSAVPLWDSKQHWWESKSLPGRPGAPDPHIRLGRHKQRGIRGEQQREAWLLLQLCPPVPLLSTEKEAAKGEGSPEISTQGSTVQRREGGRRVTGSQYWSPSDKGEGRDLTDYLQCEMTPAAPGTGQFNPSQPASTEGAQPTPPAHPLPLPSHCLSQREAHRSKGPTPLHSPRKSRTAASTDQQLPQGLPVTPAVWGVWGRRWGTSTPSCLQSHSSRVPSPSHPKSSSGPSPGAACPSVHLWLHVVPPAPEPDPTHGPMVPGG